MGNPRANLHRENDAELRRVKGGKRVLSGDEQHEVRVTGLINQINQLEAARAKDQATFDEMFRRSEAMRNRQIDIINRLLRGGTIPEELSILLEENAAYEVEIADLHAVAGTLKARVKQLEEDRQMLSDMLNPKKGMANGSDLYVENEERGA